MSLSKRGTIDGFDGIRGEKTAKRLKSWEKNQPTGKWRKVRQVKIQYTYIYQTWHHLEKEFTRKVICPWGMKDYITNVLQDEKVYRNAQVIPVEVKVGLKLEQNDYDISDMKVSCKDDGNKGYETFYLLYCEKCKADKLPVLQDKYSSYLPANAAIEDVQANWDKLVAADPSISKEVDLCGTLLPNEPTVNAGPNSRRFILRPIDHSNKCHIVSSDKKAAKPSLKRASSPSSSSDAVVVPAKKNTIVPNTGKTYKQCTKTAKDIVTGKKVSVTSKSAHGLSLDIASMIDPFVSLFQVAINEDQVIAQDHCISVIMTGAKKALSNNATLDLYTTSLNGIRQYHKKKLGNLEIDGKKIRKPVRVQVNVNNIPRIQKGIADAYKHFRKQTSLNKAPYTALTETSGRFYSIMNDGIQKFAQEFNGVFIRTIDFNFEVSNLPWSLDKIPGGSMDAEKLVQQLLQIIHEIIKFRDSSFVNAATEFIQKFNSTFPDKIPPTRIPTIFKCTKLANVDFDKKEIELDFENWPTALVADGASVNPKAGQILTERFGLVSPTTRCSGHAASGCIKRMTTSKTMQVDEMVTFADGPILKHFKLSGKSSSSLNDLLEIMDMKPLKAMAWCPTRMANILTSSKRTVEILFPICDVLATCNIKEDQAAYFLSPTSMILLHLMADLEPVFVTKFLRRLDTDEATLIEMFGHTENFTVSMEEIKTPLLDNFLSGLKEDENGNIVYEKKDKDEGNVDIAGSHSIILKASHRPNRHSKESKVDLIKKEAKSLKDKVKQNLISNAQDQNQESTIVEFASAFDLTKKAGKEIRISHIRKLHNIYGREHKHTLDDTDVQSLEGYTISINYKPKLACSENELIGEIKSLWPTITKMWLQYKDSKPMSSRIRRFWLKIIEEHAVDYPNLCDLLLLLLSISPGTGPVERSFSQLAKICYKDRNSMSAETIENLYLLAAMKINGDDEDFIAHARKYLQIKK